MFELWGGKDLLWVTLKALLLYLTAVLIFRVSRRRTVAEMSPFDFVAAVAAGAVVGRVPSSDRTSFLAGAMTLVTILSVHAIMMFLRRYPTLARIVDHPTRLLVAHGLVLEKELFRSGLTHNDLHVLLRRKGVSDLQQLEYVIYEQSGHLTVITKGSPASNGGLIAEVLDEVRHQDNTR